MRNFAFILALALAGCTAAEPEKPQYTDAEFCAFYGVDEGHDLHEHCVQVLRDARARMVRNLDLRSLGEADADAQRCASYGVDEGHLLHQDCLYHLRDDRARLARNHGVRIIDCRRLDGMILWKSHEQCLAMKGTPLN